MIQWSIEEKILQLAYTWKISRNESTSKTNFFITVTDGNYRAMGEVAPNVRYHETPESIKAEFQKFAQQGSSFRSTEELRAQLKSLKISNALSFGIESAWIHLQCLKENTTVYHYLGLNAPGKISTTYTLPIMPLEKIGVFIQQHQLNRFKTLKLKVNFENTEAFIAEVMKHTDRPIKIDANESWTDVEALLKTMHTLKKYPIEFFEQPLPGHLQEEYRYLKKHSPFELIADESVTNEADFEKIQQQFHGVNMKLMKAGGYLNGLHILNETRRLGMKTMIGCMVETTLGISSALQLCEQINYIDLDGFFVIENEPFKLVSETEGHLSLA